MTELCREVFGIQDMDWMRIFFFLRKNPTLLKDVSMEQLCAYTKFAIFWLKILTMISPSTENDRITVSTHSLQKVLNE